MMQRETTPKVQREGLKSLIGRAILLRCPKCGLGTLFKNWIRLRKGCRSCGLRYDRGEHDHFLGAYLINFIVAELLVVAALITIMIVTWPDVPWKIGRASCRERA